MKRKGFTLIELMIVVAIIGIVAAIAIPNLITAIQKGKQKATMADMVSIGTACENYQTDLYMFPNANTIQALELVIEPFYIRVLPTKDGWGSDFRYEAQASDAYSVRSWGKDQAATTVNVNNSPYVVTGMDGFNNDIVYSSGTFTYVPKVK